MNMPTRVSSSGARQLATLGAAAAVLAGSVLAASPAMAAKGDYSGDPNWTGPSTNSQTDSNGGVDNATMFGAYIPSGGHLKGKRVFCIDTGLDWPYADGYNKSDASDHTAAQLSFILAKYDKPRSDKAEQMAYDMAISEHVHRSKEIPHRDLLKSRTVKDVTDTIGWDTESKNIKAVGAEKFKDTVVPNAIKHAKTMGEEAKKYAGNGPYTVSVEVVKDKGADTGAASISLLNSEGTPVPGFAGEISVKGAKAATTTVTSADKPTVVKLSDFDGSQADVSATFKAVPTGKVTIHTPKDYKKSGYDRYNLQQVVEKQVTDVAGGHAVTAASMPQVETNISESVLKGGDEVYDNFTISGLHKDQKVDVEHTLYKSQVKPERSTEVPEDAEVLGTVTSKQVGNGEHKSPSITLPEDFAGYVTWTEKIVEDDQTESWQSDYGIAEETGLVRGIPQVTTTASETELTELPAKIHDTGVIERCFPGAELDIKTDAYFEADGKIERSAEVPEDAELLDTFEQTVTCGDDGRVEYRTADLELAEDLVEPGKTGAVTFVVSGEDSGYNTAFADDYGVPEETVTITMPAPPAPEASETPVEPKPAPEGPQKKVKTGAYLEATDEAGSQPAVAYILGAIGSLAVAGGTTALALRRKLAAEQ